LTCYALGQVKFPQHYKGEIMASKKPTTTEVAKVEADPTASVPAVFDFGQDSGLGFENQTQADMSVPFLNILQGLSPQVQEEDSPYKAGMIYNTVTEEAYKGSVGLSIIPVETEHKFVEYVPRDAGGGFVAVHEDNSLIVEKAKAASKAFGKYKTPEGNDLVETFYVYALDAETGGYLVIPFSSTKIKVYRNWKTCVNLFNHRAFGIPGKPPLFAHIVRLTTEKESRKAGDSYNFRLNPENKERVVDGKVYPAILTSMIGPKDERYLTAKSFLEMIREGRATAAHETNSQVADTVEGAASADSTKCPF
jgi:hypothetical protein